MARERGRPQIMPCRKARRSCRAVVGRGGPDAQVGLYSEHGEKGYIPCHCRSPKNSMTCSVGRPCAPSPHPIRTDNLTASPCGGINGRTAADQNRPELNAMESWRTERRHRQRRRAQVRFLSHLLESRWLASPCASVGAWSLERRAMASQAGLRMAPAYRCMSRV
jgi:hypothetical protein